MTGVINGTVEWIFAFPDRLSVTISGADRLLDTPRAELAQTLWHDVCEALAITADLPPWFGSRTTKAPPVRMPPRRPSPRRIPWWLQAPRYLVRRALAAR